MIHRLLYALSRVLPTPMRATPRPPVPLGDHPPIHPGAALPPGTIPVIPYVPPGGYVASRPATEAGPPPDGPAPGGPTRCHCRHRS